MRWKKIRGDVPSHYEKMDENAQIWALTNRHGRIFGYLEEIVLEDYSSEFRMILGNEEFSSYDIPPSWKWMLLDFQLGDDLGRADTLS